MPTLGLRRDDLRSLAVLAGVVALLVLVGVDLTAFRFAGAFGSAALVTSTFGRARQAAIVGVLCVLACVGSGLAHGYLGTSEWWVRTGVATAIAVMAVVSAHVRDQRSSHLARMTVIAEAAQRAVLRATPTSVGGLGLATRYISATRDAHVGGDLYEVAATPFGVRVIVGDVCGKGLGAVQTASAVLGAFRQAAFTEPDIAELAQGLDRAVALEPSEEEFVTVVVAEFADSAVRLVNCGHPAPIGRAHV